MRVHFDVKKLLKQGFFFAFILSGFLFFMRISGVSSAPFIVNILPLMLYFVLACFLFFVKQIIPIILHYRTMKQMKKMKGTVK